MTTKRLIVTADDMGYNVERNQGIIECFLNKAITNASIMVNGLACQDAVDLALKHGLPTGLHFNITEGLPVKKDSNYKTLTKSNGHFLGDLNLRQAAAEEKIDLSEVKQELNNQIARYVELTGCKPAYVDGHQHANIFPGLVETFIGTLAEHGIRGTRLPFDLSVNSDAWLNQRWYKFLHQISIDGQQARPELVNNNVWASDAFFGLMTMGSNMTAERLQSGIKQAFSVVAESTGAGQPITCEVMTHPGYACKGEGGCGEGADDFSQSSDREYEKSILQSNEMLNFYKANNITLMSYHQCLESMAKS